MNKKSFYDRIESEIKSVLGVQPTQNHAKIAISALDLTSLNRDDKDETIQALETSANSINGYKPATLCVFPQFLSAIHEFKKATVVIFPSGQIKADNQIHDEIHYALSQGADEIDYVADYQSFLSMESGVEDKIQHDIQDAKSACADKTLKVILESAAFGQLDELYDFAMLAIKNGADFIKTSTGKHEDGGATLDTVATMAIAIADHHRQSGQHVGLKISGGVNGKNYAQYLTLVENILGEDYVSNPETFRFGASGLFDDLKLSLDANATIMHRKQKVELGY